MSVEAMGHETNGIYRAPCDSTETTPLGTVIRCELLNGHAGLHYNGKFFWRYADDPAPVADVPPVTELERLRALVGNERYQFDEWGALPRDEVIRQASISAAKVENLTAELDTLKAKLADPAVKAVVELVEKYDHQFRRAEAAHEAKDEANRRWLEAAKAAEPPREEVATTVRSCSDKNGPHDPHDWRPDPSSGIEWCPGYPVPPAPALADDEPTAS